MTERITTGFSLPATNPNPKKKEREKKIDRSFPSPPKNYKFPSTFYDFKYYL